MCAVQGEENQETAASAPMDNGLFLLEDEA